MSLLLEISKSSKVIITYRQSQYEGFGYSKFLQNVRHVDDVVTFFEKRMCQYSFWITKERMTYQ